MKKLFRMLSIVLFVAILFTISINSVHAETLTNSGAEYGSVMLYKPDLTSLKVGDSLPGVVAQENDGFVSDGKGGLVSVTDDCYNAIYFGPEQNCRQFHYHVEMEQVVKGVKAVGGVSYKMVQVENESTGRKEERRFDLAVTTDSNDKCILIYAASTLLCDNRNEAQGGLGGQDKFNSRDKILIDVYCDRDYQAIYINNTLVIEAIVPLEGKGYFGLRAHNALITYSNIYVETLPSKFLDGRERYYPETFETIALNANKNVVKAGEEVSFNTVLNPTGKDYSEIAWYINGDLVQDAFELNYKHTFTEQGEYVVKIVVDRQVSTQTIVVGEGNSEVNNDSGCKSLVSIFDLFIAFSTVGVLILMRRKKEMH